MRINGDKIKIILIEKGMKQLELAKDAGISVTSVSTICCGKSCNLDTANKIANALGVPLSDICDRR